jgi:hypothetical protein
MARESVLWWCRVPAETPRASDVSDTALRPDIDRDRRLSDDGDHDRFAHYVPKKDLMRAMVEGLPVTALCGKRWVPSRDPERYPVCPTCKELMSGLRGA